jgi:membrane-associated protease RseP (regulator of RpoE activity)
VKAAKNFVCVRVTDMRGVDLNAYSFDFDLTFAVLVVQPNGHVLHRYGGRDHHSADDRLTMSSLVGFLRAAEKSVRNAPLVKREAVAPRTLDDIPVWRDKIARRKKKLDCYHCHFVFDAEREQKRADKTWTRDQIWRWPTPTQVGMHFKREALGVLAKVDKKSVAAKSGLRAGDHVLSADRQPILTALDFSAVLENKPRTKTKVSLRYERRGKERTATLELAKGWKEGTSLQFSWRPSKWALHPRPGFGGRPLNLGERKKLGLPSKGLAFRVGYIVDWGGADDRRYGKHARQQGIRKGDLVVGVKGAPDLRNPEHFHSWWRLETTPGQNITLRILRKGKALDVVLTVLPGKK